MEVEFRTIPLAGFMRPRSRDRICPRLKLCLIYAAGPGIEIALVILLGFAIEFDRLASRSESIPVIVAQGFSVAALLGAFLNLLPFPHRSDSGAVSWSDGLGMLMSWRLPDEFFAAPATRPDAEEQG